MNEAGAFDPRFPGLFLRFQRDNFETIYSGLEDELVDGRGLFELASFGYEISGTTLSSTIVHEVRHLFDFYTSPWLVNTIDSKVKSVIALPAFVAHLRAKMRVKPADHRKLLLPAPLITYVYMSKEERRQAISRSVRELEILGVDVENEYIVCWLDDLPEFDASDELSVHRYASANPNTPYAYLCVLAENFRMQQKSLFSAEKNSDLSLSFSTYSIVEYLALMMQIGFLNGMQNEIHTEALKGFIANSVASHGLYQRYLQLQGGLAQHLDKAGIDLAVICSWSLSGDVSNNEFPSNPTNRFTMAIEALIAGKLEGSDMFPLAVLDEYFGTRSHFQSGDEAAKIISNTQNWVAGLAANERSPSGQKILEWLTWYVDAIGVGQEHLCKLSSLGIVQGHVGNFCGIALEMSTRFPTLMHNGTVGRRGQVWQVSDDARPSGIARQFHRLGENKNSLMLHAQWSDIKNWQNLYLLLQMTEQVCTPSAGNPKFQSSSNELTKICSAFGFRPFFI